MTTFKTDIVIEYPRLIEGGSEGPSVQAFRSVCPTPQALWIQLEDAMKERLKIAVLRKKRVIP